MTFSGNNGHCYLRHEALEIMSQEPTGTNEVVRPQDAELVEPGKEEPASMRVSIPLYVINLCLQEHFVHVGSPDAA